MAQFNDNNTITYQQLVMGQIKIIQNIASKELRDSTKTVKNLVGEQLIEAEDTRHSFLQSIEILGSLLSPYFNDDTKVKSSFNNYCELLYTELKGALEDKEFKESVEKLFNKKNIMEIIQTDDDVRSKVNIYLLNFKIREGKEMFRILLKVFKDHEFLTESSYGEGSSDTDSNLDAEDDEE